MSRPVAIERIIARILTFGGLFSIALVLGGLVVYAAEGHPQAREIVRVVHNREAGPVLGVAAAAVAFWRSGDRDYAAISGIVLAMLVLSFALAAAG